jgi:hypothetical protein
MFECAPWLPYYMLRKWSARKSIGFSGLFSSNSEIASLR